MNAVVKSLNGIRSWTDAQRAEQAAKLHARKIWLKSTGPRTPEGKAASSANARKPDYEYRMADRAELRAMNAYLRTQKSYIDLLNIFHKQWDRLNAAQHDAVESQLYFLENELIAIERDIFGGLTFSEVISGNIIAFPNPPPPYREK